MELSVAVTMSSHAVVESCHWNSAPAMSPVTSSVVLSPAHRSVSETSVAVSARGSHCAKTSVAPMAASRRAMAVQRGMAMVSARTAG